MYELRNSILDFIRLHGLKVDFEYIPRAQNALADAAAQKARSMKASYVAWLGDDDNGAAGELAGLGGDDDGAAGVLAGLGDDGDGGEASRAGVELVDVPLQELPALPGDVECFKCGLHAQRSELKRCDECGRYFQATCED